MFSERSSFPSEANALSRAIADARERGCTLHDLTASNPTTAALPYDERGILEALAAPGALVYDPAPFGLLSARTAVGERLGVDPEKLVLTAGTSEAYAFLFDLLCDPGDEVLVPRPSYPLVEWLAKLEGVVPRFYDLAYDGEWHVDAGSLRRAITPSTRAILVVSPNNPTGHVLSEHDRTLLQSTGLPLIVDAVFAAYPLEREAPIPNVIHARAGLTFTLTGLSKLAALPQLKLAFLAVSGDDALVREALSRLETIADTFLSVASPVQHAAGRLLDRSEITRDAIRARTARNLAAIDARLGTSSVITRLRAEAGWYAMLRLPAIESEERYVVDFVEQGVIVHPGHFFDLHGPPCIVLSLLTPEHAFDAGLERIVSHVEAKCSAG